MARPDTRNYAKSARRFDPRYQQGGEVEGEFDPEGSDYDYRGAAAAGIKPDDTGHWASRDPSSGLILKGRGHETFSKTEQGERDAGYEIQKKGNRYYSFPKSE